MIISFCLPDKLLKSKFAIIFELTKFALPNSSILLLLTLFDGKIVDFNLDHLITVLYLLCFCKFFLFPSYLFVNINYNTQNLILDYTKSETFLIFSINRKNN